MMESLETQIYLFNYLIKISRGTEVVGGSKAEGKLTFTYENFNGTGATDVELRLYVGRDTYSVSGINF